MASLGNWVVQHATYITVLQGDWCDGDEDMIVGTKGQTMVVCDGLVPLYDDGMLHVHLPATKISYTKDGIVGQCTCSECGERVHRRDLYCWRCGASFEVACNGKP